MTDQERADWVRETYGINIDAEIIGEPARVAAENTAAVRDLAGRLAFEAEPADFLRERQNLAPRNPSGRSK